MPVINVKSLPVNDHTNIPEILIRLNASVAEAMEIKPEHVWSYWEFIKSGFYSVGKDVAAETHEQSHSPIITITGIEGTPQEKISKAFEAIAKLIASELEIDYGNVFIVYDELKRGMVFGSGETIK